MYKKNARNRREGRLNKFIQTCPQYAIWDDHDFGPDNSTGDYTQKNYTLDIFKRYWANPYYGETDSSGNYSHFSYQDADFFLLDDRYNKTTLQNSTPKMLGDEQMNWLKEKLELSNAVFKFIVIGSQVLSPTRRSDECLQGYVNEYDDLIDFLVDKSIDGVVFLSGDRHFSELQKLKRNNTYTIYDFTCSPLTSMPVGKRHLNATAGRVPNTYYGNNNYGKISISGEKGNRSLLLQVLDSKSEQVWEYTIQEQELR